MKSRLIAVDFGLKRIGVALSDEGKSIAAPLAVVAAEKKMDKTVQRLKKALDEDCKAKQYTIEKIIVGLPLLMSGKAGLMADEVRHFIELLKEAYPEVDIIAWDERLTSVLADRVMREANLSRKKRASHVDSLSAVIILQNYLDFRATS